MKGLSNEKVVICKLCGLSYHFTVPARIVLQGFGAMNRWFALQRCPECGDNHWLDVTGMGVVKE